MIKKFLLALVFLALLGGALVGIKALQIQKMIAKNEAMVLPPAVVSTINATTDTWESVLSAVGTITAVQGVTLTAEEPGRVIRIDFDSGAQVKAGDILVQLDTSTESAQLRALQASENLARITLTRMTSLVKQGTATKSEYDTALATHQQILAEIDALQSRIDKKTIRAPFTGILGIRQVNLGQNLGTEAVIATLQYLDTIQVEFSLPQQQIAPVQPGTLVRVFADLLPDQMLTGQIKAVEPLADSATRTVRVQAVLDNPEHILRPGMFVRAEVILPDKQQVILVPATAVAYAAYGNSIFFVEADDRNQGLILRQQFVTLGQRRGDYVAVTKGVQVGQTVVSTGVFKYRNGQSVIVDNSLAPEFELQPSPENS